MIFKRLIISKNEVFSSINSAISQKSSKLLTYFNQHCFNIYFSNSDYKNLIDTKFSFYIDGIGMYFASMLFGIKKIKKFNASDLNNCLFEQFVAKKTKLFLIGGDFSEAVIQEIQHKKRLNICGYKNGFLNNDELPDLIREIDKSGADIILIGMGVPKQELLAYELSGKIRVDLLICVGNFFEFYFDTKKRAPEFLRNSGFEWLFRLLTEPKRLWKRYLIGIPLFLYRIYKMKLKFNKYISN